MADRALKARIRAGDSKLGEPQMVYPIRWNPEEIDRYGGCSMLNPGQLDVCMSGEIGRGGSEQFIYFALPEPLALEYAEDPNIMLVDSIEADAGMEKNRIGNNRPSEQVRDPNRLAAIQAKQGAGIALSQEDLDALDPENPVRGINKTHKPARESRPDIDDDLSRFPERLKTMQR